MTRLVRFLAPPRCAALAQAPPMVATSLLPRHRRAWLDEHQSGLATGPETAQPDPEQAIGQTGVGRWAVCWSSAHGYRRVRCSTHRVPKTGRVPQRRSAEPRGRAAASATSSQAHVSRGRSPLVQGEDDRGTSQVCEPLLVFGTDRGAVGHPGGLRGATPSYPRKEAYACCDVSTRGAG